MGSIVMVVDDLTLLARDLIKVMFDTAGEATDDSTLQATANAFRSPMQNDDSCSPSDVSSSAGASPSFHPGESFTPDTDHFAPGTHPPLLLNALRAPGEREAVAPVEGIPGPDHIDPACCCMSRCTIMTTDRVIAGITDGGKGLDKETCLLKPLRMG
jgi:hypothetical protein